MRVLKQSTVKRELVRRGWHWDGRWLRWFAYGNVQVVAEFWPEDGAGLKLFDARAKGHPNVHVVSYWGPFPSRAKLASELDRAERVYTELCGALFHR